MDRYMLSVHNIHHVVSCCLVWSRIPRALSDSATDSAATAHTWIRIYYSVSPVPRCSSMHFCQKYRGRRDSYWLPPAVSFSCSPLPLIIFSFFLFLFSFFLRSHESLWSFPNLQPLNFTRQNERNRCKTCQTFPGSQYAPSQTRGEESEVIYAEKGLVIITLT